MQLTDGEVKTVIHWRINATYPHWKRTCQLLKGSTAYLLAWIGIVLCFIAFAWTILLSDGVENTTPFGIALIIIMLLGCGIAFIIHRTQRNKIIQLKNQKVLSPPATLEKEAFDFYRSTGELPQLPNGKALKKYETSFK